MFWNFSPLGAKRLNRGKERGALVRRLRIEPLEQRFLLSLGTAALAEGPAAGSDSDIVATAGNWTATANAAWLHATSSGSGSGLATFSFDANTGAPRTAR